MRQMLALQPIARHEGCSYSPGDYFVASEADARYLIKHGRAAPVTEASAVVPAPVRRGPGRPRKVPAE